jgi:hypothetical protein
MALTVKNAIFWDVESCARVRWFSSDPVEELVECFKADYGCLLCKLYILQTFLLFLLKMNETCCSVNTIFTVKHFLFSYE